ncbi:MAG: GNAT family N-acetyltransferase, partial [Eubacteriales bacterium]
MVLRKLTHGDIPAAKHLWMEAFGDSEEFVRYYFANKLKLKNTMGAFIKGELVGDITMQEMIVHLRGADIQTGFLAGCATRQEFRNQHIMQQLLFAQMRAMDRNGYAICHLHPFLHAFYRKFGWETVSYMRQEIKKPQKNTRNSNNTKENLSDFDTIYKLYMMFCNRADGYFQRTPQDMAIRLQEHEIDGGGFMATQGAYALFFEQQGMLDVIEFVWREQQDKEELLALLAETGSTVQFYTPDYAGEGTAPKEYTMMRVVNVVRLLEKLPLADCRFTI